MAVSNPATETGFEDIQSIENDINKLFEKFIRPIDNIRSMARPIGTAQPSKAELDAAEKLSNFTGLFKNLQIDNVKPLESRVHAFYRMLGFPVVASDGTFYNPGFDPEDNKKQEKKSSINSKINSLTQLYLNNREYYHHEMRRIFTRQDNYSSFYSLVLKFPRPFNLIDEGKGPLETDNQVYAINERFIEIENLKANNPQLADSIESAAEFFSLLPPGNSFAEGKHLLRPFIVDPNLEVTVMPDRNRICVPFLKSKKETKIDSTTYLQRPGIELIIRERLKQDEDKKEMLQQIERILKGTKGPNQDSLLLSKNDLIDTISIIADDDEIEINQVTETAQSVTNMQLLTTFRLVKLMKVVIKELADSINVINNVSSNITFLPIPGQDGPETGSRGASLNQLGINRSSKIDKRIAELKIKKFLSERKETSNTEDLGEFASPFSVTSNPEKNVDYGAELQKEIAKRDKLAKDAFEAMKKIEIILGEVSGLGLIDILAIYTALWTIDMSTLLNFLDDDAFSRLVSFNPELETAEVTLRSIQSSPNMISTLTGFERKLASIFDFCQKIFDEQQLAPGQTSGGNI